MDGQRLRVGSHEEKYGKGHDNSAHPNYWKKERGVGKTDKQKEQKTTERYGVDNRFSLEEQKARLKEKGMPMRKDMAYWSSRSEASPNKFFGSDNTMKNDVSTSGQPGNNMQLIEALKKEDEVKKQVEALKSNNSNKIA